MFVQTTNQLWMLFDSNPMERRDFLDMILSVHSLTDTHHLNKDSLPLDGQHEQLKEYICNANSLLLPPDFADDQHADTY